MIRTNIDRRAQRENFAGYRLYKFFILLAALSISNAATGLSLPDRKPGPISDFADILSADTEANLIGQIEIVARETGFEIVLVTIDSPQLLNWSGNLDNLAGRIRRDWDLADRTRDTGILILISKHDHAAAVSTGSAYPQRFVTEPISSFMDATKTPLSRRNFNKAALRGVEEISNGLYPPSTSNLTHLFGGVALALLLILPFGLITLQKREWLTVRFRRCPYCTRKSLKLDRQVQTYVNNRPGKQKEKSRIYCTWCGYRKDNETLSTATDHVAKAIRRSPDIN